MGQMNPIGVGLTLAGAGLQAYASNKQGQEGYYSAEFERKQLEISAQQHRTAAAQAETARRDEAETAFETIMALRAGRGVGTTSPTARAIFEKISNDTEREVAIERSNFLQKADLNRRAAFLAERKGKASLLAGKIGAAAAIVNAGAGLYKVQAKG